MAVLSFKVPEEWDGATVSEFLRKAHGVSGTVLKKAKRKENGLTLDEKHIRTVDCVRSGAVVRINVDDEVKKYRPLFLNIPVLYEDESFVAFDKPPGMAVHPSAWHPYDTLANVYAARKETEGLIYRPVGRLDRDTTGIVLVAKNAHAAYAVRVSEKRYLALAAGKPPRDSGTVNVPIGREGEDSRRRCVREDGQPSVTHYRVLMTEGGVSLVELLLETGRTHQIRVHMEHIGCPLIGDSLYGGDMNLIKRQALHCSAITFYHPIREETVRIECPLPTDMKEALAKAKNVM